MELDDCLVRSIPAVRVRLKGTRRDPEDLLEVTVLYGSSPLLLAYADLLSPAIQNTVSGVSLVWDGLERDFRDGASEDITELVGRLAPEPVLDEVIAGIVAHFWTLALRSQGGCGRFLEQPRGLAVRFEARGDGGASACAAGLELPGSIQPLAGIFRSIGSSAKAIFGLSHSERGAFLRELRSLQGDSLLIPVYASLLAPVVDLSLGGSSLRFLHARLCYDPFHVDLLHGCKTYESESFLRAAGETIAYFWTLQLRLTGQRGHFAFDESEGMDVVLVEDGQDEDALCGESVGRD